MLKGKDKRERERQGDRERQIEYFWNVAINICLPTLENTPNRCPFKRHRRCICSNSTDIRIEIILNIFGQKNLQCNNSNRTKLCDFF